jgi:hypothetical protein
VLVEGCRVGKYAGSGVTDCGCVSLVGDGGASAAALNRPTANAVAAANTPRPILAPARSPTKCKVDESPAKRGRLCIKQLTRTSNVLTFKSGKLRCRYRSYRSKRLFGPHPLRRFFRL